MARRTIVKRERRATITLYAPLSTKKALRALTTNAQRGGPIEVQDVFGRIVGWFDGTNPEILEVEE